MMRLLSFFFVEVVGVLRSLRFLVLLLIMYMCVYVFVYMLSGVCEYVVCVV